MFSERVGLQGLREFNNLRANVLSEFIKNHVMLCYAMELQCTYQPGLSTLHLNKKHLRSVIVFLDVTVNQVGSQHELLTSVKRRKVREYVSVVYECICSSTPIKVKRSEKFRNV